MKTVWIAAIAIVASASAAAQTTIYKHVDEGGRITYSNKPMKGATVMELEPLTTIPATPNGTLQKQKRPYTTPVLTVHGTLEELTKTTDKKFGPTDGFTFEGNPITNVS